MIRNSESEILHEIGMSRDPDWLYFGLENLQAAREISEGEGGVYIG